MLQSTILAFFFCRFCIILPLLIQLCPSNSACSLFLFPSQQLESKQKQQRKQHFLSHLILNINQITMSYGGGCEQHSLPFCPIAFEQSFRSKADQLMATQTAAVVQATAEAVVVDGDPQEEATGAFPHRRANPVEQL
jgi:hypothetical protein